MKSKGKILGERTTLFEESFFLSPIPPLLFQKLFILSLIRQKITGLNSRS